MLPQKTFLTKDCALYESDFDVTGDVKPHRVMELMQDVATTHADELGFGWDYMDKNGLFWIISKVKIVFTKPVTRRVRNFRLYTWPIKANKFFIERRFAAVDENGDELFCCTTLWMIVERDTRRIAGPKTIAEYYVADFDDTAVGASTDFARIKRDETFSLQYEREIKRTDLDINRHVNNTNYVNFAMDVLTDCDKIDGIEIVYHKELKLGDALKVFAKREADVAYVVGERANETCFTAKLALRKD
ncbi:MAG: thioesterase [Firmicutes bacterium]|nr:thioesterase [Bacillota bacterium]